MGVGVGVGVGVGGYVGVGCVLPWLLYMRVIMAARTYSVANMSMKAKTRNSSCHGDHSCL